MIKDQLLAISIALGTFASLPAAAEEPASKTSEASPCDHDVVVKYAGEDFKGSGWVSEDGFTVYWNNAAGQETLVPLFLEAYHIQQKNGCVSSALEDMLRKAGRI